MTWQTVDQGWGRTAVVFATLAEPASCREYVAVHQRLGVGAGDRLLDVACGSGLAAELARIRGAAVAGIDASPRLIAVAADRNPGCDFRVGDMGDLPWDDASFDVVTSFRGIWGTTPGAVQEAQRVLVPGGRLAITCWGDVGKSPGAWAFAPLLWAGEARVRHQADMVALGRPGIGEAFLADAGFEVAERVEVPFVIEYADPGTYARAIAAVGPAFEAIEEIGEVEFLRRAREHATERVREGLPLRGEIQDFLYVGTKR
jgi:SAM-dependent methyltransferase